MHADLLAYRNSQPLLDVRALRKSFARGLARAQSRTFALLDIDLTLAYGEVMCVSGDESAGKTALLQCIAGLLKRDAGVIRWFGEPMIPGSPPKDVIFVSATPLYYPFLSVRDVVQAKMLRSQSDPLPWSSLETVAMLELDMRLDSRIADLSRAELRCLSIVEAITQRPRAILIDTSASELRHLPRTAPIALREFADKGGAVMIAVRDPLPLSDAATQIIVLHEGSVRQTFYADSAITVKSHPPLLLAETLH